MIVRTLSALNILSVHEFSQQMRNYADSTNKHRLATNLHNEFHGLVVFITRPLTLIIYIPRDGIHQNSFTVTFLHYATAT